MNPQELSKLTEIKEERGSLINDIILAQARLIELNIQRQNIIMG